MHFTHDTDDALQGAAALVNTAPGPRQGDLLPDTAALEAFDDLAGEVDVVVSNPPYVPHHMEPVDPEVRDHDPALALYGGGRDGLDLPRRILARAAVLLHPGGTVVLEHAEVQSGALLDHAAADPAWSDARDVPDLTGRPRALVATRTAAPPPASPPRVR